MKLLIDDAHIEDIRDLYRCYPIDGVTTNPSILAKTGRAPKEVLSEIREFIGEKAMLFVQALGNNAEEMVQDAEAIVKAFGKNTIVKVPSIEEGFRAIAILKEKGIITCGTVVYTPMQAYLAAKAGASYVAPYVNRIDNMGYDGTGTVQKIQNILENNGMDCEVLAASFKNSQQVLELCEYGVGAATAAPDVIRSFIKNPAIDKAAEDFVKDFEKLTAPGTTMKDVL